MNFTKLVSLLLLVFAFTFATVNARADSNSVVNDRGFSSPQVQLNTNGDLSSPYPPYFHNDK